MASGDGKELTNLIVNYLPQTLTDDELYEMFFIAGPIRSCNIARDKNTNYSYGFGFVEFERAEDAQHAIHLLNRTQLENKTIKVALARPRGENTSGANLYIRNLPRAFSEEDVNAYFSPYGQIIQSRVLANDPLGKGIGFVLYETKQQANEAIIQLNGTTLPGGNEPLEIKFAKENAKKVRPPQQHPPSPYGGGFQGSSGLRYSGPRYAEQRYAEPRYAEPRYAEPRYAEPTYEELQYEEPQQGPGPMRSQGGNRASRYSPMGSGYRSPAPRNPVPRGPPAASGGYILFAYNIGLDADEKTLFQLFSPYGAIQKVDVIYDLQKGQCKGFGFVTMTNYDEAEYAIEQLNGYNYSGRPLQVSFKTDK